MEIAQRQLGDPDLRACFLQSGSEFGQPSLRIGLPIAGSFKLFLCFVNRWHDLRNRRQNSAGNLRLLSQIGSILKRGKHLEGSANSLLCSLHRRIKLICLGVAQLRACELNFIRSCSQRLIGGQQLLLGQVYLFLLLLWVCWKRLACGA